MIEELKSFWSNYDPYKLHPEDENYLSQNKQKYCLEISIEELRTKYGSDLKSDNTRKKFVLYAIENLRIERSGRIFGTRLFTVVKNVGQLKMNEQVANLK